MHAINDPTFPPRRRWLAGEEESSFSHERNKAEPFRPTDEEPTQGRPEIPVTIRKTPEIRTRQYNRCLIPDSADIQALCSDDRRKSIRATIREELWKLSPFPLLEVTSINEAVGEEIQEPLCVPQQAQLPPLAMSHAAAVRHHAHPSRPRQGAALLQFRHGTPPPLPTPSSTRVNQCYAPRKTDI